MVALGIGQGAVHIVADDEDGLVLQDLVDGVQSLFGVDAAGGVVGRGEDDGLGLVRNGGLQLLGVDLEAVVGGGEHHLHAPVQLHDGLIETEIRGGDDDLVAGVHDGGEGNIQRLRCADGGDDLIGRVVEVVLFRLELGDGLQQVGVAVAGRIVGVVGVQGGLGGFLHNLRGIQVGLTDGQCAGAGGVTHHISKAADAGDLHIHHSAVESQFHRGSRSLSV